MADKKRYEAAIKSFNKYGGYGGPHVTRKNSGQQQIIDRIFARSFGEAVQRQYDLEVGDIRSNEDDPPDCFITISERTYGLELTQLVDERQFHRLKQGEPILTRESFAQMSYSPDRLHRELDTRLTQKERRYANSGRSVDILLIHTSEPLLFSEDIKGWWQTFHFTPRKHIRYAFLMLGYDPAQKALGYPLFKLYGDL